MNIQHEMVESRYDDLIACTKNLIESKAQIGELHQALTSAIANYTARGLIMQAPKHGKNKEERDGHAKVVLAHHYADIAHAQRRLDKAVYDDAIARLRVQELKLHMQLEGMNLEAQRIEDERNVLLLTRYPPSHNEPAN